LYRWRIHPDSTGSGVEAKPAASEAGRRAIQDYLGRRQMEAEVLEVDGGRYRVKYKLLGEPEVRIIVPTGGSDTLFTALQTALQKSSYPNFKITVVDNSKGDSVCQVVDKIKANDSRIEVIDCRNIPFNFSYLCNYAAARCESPYLLFLNDDTSVITADWLEAMMEHAQRNEVGAVGAQLLFPNETVQHAGVVMGLQGIAGHAFRGLPPELHYFALSQYIRNCAAVTGACLLTRRNAFEAVKGFDEANLPTCFQDVDLCLRLWERGYRIVYTPYAKLYHYESYSKKVIANRSEMDYMRARWANIIADDPFYNPNLTRVSDDYSLNYGRLFPRVDAAIANQREAGAMHDYEQSEKLKCRVNVRHLGQIDFYAVPNPSPARDGYGQTTLFWNVTGVKKIQIRVGTPAGALFVDGPPSGNASTGSWVEPDTTFYLLDSTKTNTPSADQLLAILVVSVLPADQPQSQTMVRHI
jgi:GT2 family glycosyltransferase